MTTIDVILIDVESGWLRAGGAVIRYVPAVMPFLTTKTFVSNTYHIILYNFINYTIKCYIIFYNIKRLF